MGVIRDTELQFFDFKGNAILLEVLNYIWRNILSKLHFCYPKRYKKATINIIFTQI